jgi:hypothetical protein
MSTSSPPAGERSTSDDRQSRASGTTARFLLAVGQEVGTGRVTPAALARAAVRVLPVDAAGLSMMVNVLRLPLGASSDDATQAEELQSTLGEGPCLDAAESQTELVADLADIEARWPLYADELTGTTPFRAVAAIPLRAPGGSIFAALDLYSTGERLRDRLDLAEVDEVRDPLAALLGGCVEEVGDGEGGQEQPEWYRQASSRRHDVWVAIGMVMATRGGRRRDALSLLRAHAYSQARSLDDLAADIIEGRLPLAELAD